MPSAVQGNHSGYSLFAGGHRICIYGYDGNINPNGADADHRGGLRMVNSWGEGWNGSSAGYAWLSYDFVKRCAWEAWTMNDLGPDTPTITSLSATQAAAGSTIHIYGGNFGTMQSKSGVSLNGVKADSAAFSDAQISRDRTCGRHQRPAGGLRLGRGALQRGRLTVSGTVAGPQVTSITPGRGMQSTSLSVASLAGAVSRPEPRSGLRAAGPSSTPAA